MSEGLSQAEVANASYQTIRGWAAHRLLPELFGRPDWIRLVGLKPRAFQRKILELGNQVDCEVTRNFLRNNPQEAKWLAGCYRKLLKCLLRDWRISEVLVVEPQLPTILLPNGMEIRCGMPDMMGDSATFDGLVTIEMKTGHTRIKRQAAKLARYNSGANILAQDHGLRRPFRGTIWISFSSTRIERKSGRRLTSHKPVLTYHFEPYNDAHISTLLNRKFGIVADEIEGLPRHYHPQFA